MVVDRAHGDHEPLGDLAFAGRQADGWVLRGWAPPALLDSYEAERRPVAEYTTARSADPGGSRRAAEQKACVPVGVRPLHAVAAHAVGAPAGSALLARSDGTPVGVIPAGAEPVASLRLAVAGVARGRCSERPAKAIGSRSVDPAPAPC